MNPKSLATPQDADEAAFRDWLRKTYFYPEARDSKIAKIGWDARGAHERKEKEEACKLLEECAYRLGGISGCYELVTKISNYFSAITKHRHYKEENATDAQKPSAPPVDLSPLVKELVEALKMAETFMVAMDKIRHIAPFVALDKATCALKSAKKAGFK